MAELPQLPDESVWLVVVAAVELLTRKQAIEGTSDSEIQKDIKVPLSLLSDLDPKDINYDLRNTPVFRDQVLDLHKMAKTSGVYDGIANVALGLVLVLLFVGLVIGSKGGVIGAFDTIVPALGPVIYASILPVLVGIIASWKSQAILSENLFPKVIEMLSDPTNGLAKAVTARRSFLAGRAAAENDNILGDDTEAAKTAPYTDTAEPPITPMMNERTTSKEDKAVDPETPPPTNKVKNSRLD